MHRGGAGSILWEFSIPNASNILNLTIPIKALRGIKHGKLARPLTPFEMMKCKGKAIDLTKLWGDLHSMFCKCVGKRENVLIKQHAERGFEGIFFGPIASNGNIEQYGYYMLRYSDRKVMKVRTVICYPDVFPMVASPERSRLSAYTDQGGEEEEEEDEGDEDEEDEDGNTSADDEDNDPAPTPSPSGPREPDPAEHEDPDLHSHEAKRDGPNLETDEDRSECETKQDNHKPSPS